MYTKLPSGRQRRQKSRVDPGQSLELIESIVLRPLIRGVNTLKLFSLTMMSKTPTCFQRCLLTTSETRTSKAPIHGFHSDLVRLVLSLVAWNHWPALGSVHRVHPGAGGTQCLPLALACFVNYSNRTIAGNVIEPIPMTRIPPPALSFLHRRGVVQAALAASGHQLDCSRLITRHLIHYRLYSTSFPEHALTAPHSPSSSTIRCGRRK
jgi:hypothetical protein